MSWTCPSCGHDEELARDSCSRCAAPLPHFLTEEDRQEYLRRVSEGLQSAPSAQATDVNSVIGQTRVANEDMDQQGTLTGESLQASQPSSGASAKAQPELLNEVGVQQRNVAGMGADSFSRAERSLSSAAVPNEGSRREISKQRVLALQLVTWLLLAVIPAILLNSALLNMYYLLFKIFGNIGDLSIHRQLIKEGGGLAILSWSFFAVYSILGTCVNYVFSLVFLETGELKCVVRRDGFLKTLTGGKDLYSDLLMSFVWGLMFGGLIFDGIIYYVRTSAQTAMVVSGTLCLSRQCFFYFLTVLFEDGPPFPLTVNIYLPRDLQKLHGLIRKAITVPPSK